MNVARMVARSPLVIRGLDRAYDSGEIQIFANEIRQATNVEFITVFDMNHRRRSHPDSSKVGQYFVGGDEDQALTGEEYISVAQGTLGQSLRAFTPVYAPDGRQLGAVAVGILQDNIRLAVRTKSGDRLFGQRLGTDRRPAGRFFTGEKYQEDVVRSRALCHCQPVGRTQRHAAVGTGRHFGG